MALPFSLQRRTAYRWVPLLFSIAFFLSSPSSAALICKSTNTTGNWSANNTWTGCSGALPGPSDTVEISTGCAITMDVSTTIAALRFYTSGAGTNATLTHSGNVTLTITGGVVLNAPGNTNTSITWDINSTTTTVGGLINFITASNTRVRTIKLSSGELDANGGITSGGSTASNQVIDLSAGAAMLKLKGALTAPAASLTLLGGGAGSVFNYADTTSSQVITMPPAGSYDNLWISNGSTSSTLGAAITASNVTGNVRIVSGTLNGGNFSISGGGTQTFQIDDGAFLRLSGTSTFPTNFVYSLGANSKVEYLQNTSPVTVSSCTYGNVDLKPPSTVKMNLGTGTITVQGDLTIGDGVNIASCNANTAGSNSLIVQGTVTISAKSIFLPSTTTVSAVAGGWQNLGVVTADVSTVAFNGTAAEYVFNAGQAFGHVLSSNTSSGGIIFSSSFTAKRLTLDSSALGATATAYFAGLSTFTISTFVVRGSASYPVTLKSTDSTKSWYLNNTAQNSVSNVQVQRSSASSGIAIVAQPVSTDLGNNANWAFSPLWTGAVSSNWGTGGNWSNNSVPTSTDDVGIPLAGAPPTLDANRSVKSLTISAGVVLSLNNFNLTVVNDLSSAGTITASGGEQIKIGGNWDNTTGTFTPAQSTVTFQSSSGQTVQGVIPFTYIVSSNTSSMGLTFTSSFTAKLFTIDATALASAATVYFMAGGTFTISTFSVNGNSTNHVVLKSLDSSTSWTLTTTTSSVSYVEVQRSDASHGHAIGAGTSSVDLGNNLNWGLGDFFGAISVNGSNSAFSYGSVALGDVNNDGILDVVGSGYRGGGGIQTWAFIGNGDGTFQTTPVYVAAVNVGLNSGGTALGDLDNDGNLDVVTMGAPTFAGGNYEVRAYFNNGDGTFNTNFVSVATSAAGMENYGGGTAIVLGDFNNDGNLDVAAVGAYSSGNLPYQVLVYINNGDRTFSQTPIFVAAMSNGLNSSSLAAADVDNDGDLDILVDGVDNTNTNTYQAWLYKNNGDGTFNQTPANIAAAGAGYSYVGVAAADIDNDGDIDFLADGGPTGGKGVASFYRGSMTGTFNTTAVAVSTTANATEEGGAALADIDGDGDLDAFVSGNMLASGSCYRIAMFKNNGNGTFASPVDLVPMGYGLDRGTVVAGDLNGDGMPDVVVNGFPKTGSASSSIWAFLSNQSPSNFSTPVPPANITASWVYNANGSSLTFKWDGGTYETGHSSCSLYYNVWVATNPTSSTVPLGNFSSILSPLRSTPMFGNVGRAALKTWPNDTYQKFGVLLSTMPDNGTKIATGKTYYFRVQTIDSALRASSWSDEHTVFTGIPATDYGNRFWVSSGTSSWHNSANWSYTSGGAGGAPIPVATNTVVFDGAGGFMGNCVTTAAITVSSLSVTWASGTFNSNGYQLKVTSGLYQSSGYILLGTSSLVLNGDIRLAGGYFDGSQATVTFESSSRAQIAQTAGRPFFLVVSSNTSSGGLTLASSMTAQGLFVDASVLGATPTLYFNSLSTFSFSTFTIIGTSGNHVVLNSTDGAHVWYLNNTASSTVKYANVQYSSASLGLSITANSSTNLGNNTNWTFPSSGSPDGFYTTTGSGNWYSTTPDAPWPSGVVPSIGSTVTIANTHVVTATCPVTIASITVSSGGQLRFDGSTLAVTFTVSYGSFTNNGAVVVVSSQNAVTLQGTSSHVLPFRGTDIDYNARKLFVGYLDYFPALSLVNGETLELSNACTFEGSITTAAGSKLIQGNASDLTIGGNATFATGTFIKSSGTGRFVASGVITLNTSRENVGQFQTAP